MTTSLAPVSPQSFGPVTREMLKDYAEASGDPNPIHLDDEVAKKMGLPSVIAHGMLIAAWLCERAEHYRESSLGDSWMISDFHCRFLAMTFPGDTLSIGGEAKSVSDHEVRLELNAKKAGGDLVNQGHITLRKSSVPPA